MQRRSHNRSVDLAKLLSMRSRSKTRVVNGNHIVELAYSFAPPSFELCNGCKYALQCLSSEQMDTHTILNEHMPCVYPMQDVKFYYHETVCLVFNKVNVRVHDDFMYGYSVTTSKNIRYYLEALEDNFEYLKLNRYKIETIIKIFRADKEKRVNRVFSKRLVEEATEHRLQVDSEGWVVFC